MPKLPDRWLDYSAIGNVVDGTCIIPFKVPLKPEDFRSGARQRSKLTTEDIARRIPRLGLVVSLTNTQKYYRLDDWTRYGIEYKWIKTEGHVVPKNKLLEDFFQTVHDFTKQQPDKLVGVHCTHGLNRTGYFVCSYMVLCKRMSPIDAIDKFGLARGHRIERQNYIDAITAHSIGPSPEVFDRFRQQNGRDSSQRNVDNTSSTNSVNSWRQERVERSEHPRSTSRPSYREHDEPRNRYREPRTYREHRENREYRTYREHREHHRENRDHRQRQNDSSAFYSRRYGRLSRGNDE